MAPKTIAVSCLVLGLALAACGGPPEPDAPVGEQPETAAQPASEAATDLPPAPELQARAGLVRVEDADLRVVRDYTARFYAGDLAALHERFSEEFKESMSLEVLTALHENVRNNYGEELSVVGEESQARGEYRGFVRWARFEKYDGVVELLWILRDDDSIAGFFVRPTERPRS